MASLMPNGKQQYFDPTTGAPLVGGMLYTYVGGTSTPKATFADAGATITNTNPVVLDATGSAVVFWSGNYKIQLQDARGNTIYTVDNYIDPLTAVNTALSALQLADYAALRAYSGTQTAVYVTGYLITNTPTGIAGNFIRDDHDTTNTDNGGTVIVAANGVRWKRSYIGPVNVIWFGAKADFDGTTGTDDTVAVQAALNASANVYFPGMCRVTADITMSKPYPVLTGNGKYSSCGITRTGVGAGTVLTFSAATLYPKMRGVYVRWVPTTSTDYFNTGTVGIDVTSANTSIDMEDCWVRGCETNVKGAYNGFYNRFVNCRFEESKYPLFSFSNNNLTVRNCRFKGFMDSITLNGTGGPANITENWFEVFNGAIVASSGSEEGVVNVHNNYVEIYDNVSLPTNFPQAANALPGKFGGNVLFTGPFGTLSIKNNELGLGGVYIIASLSLCDRLESVGNNLHLYTSGGNLRYMYNLPTIQSCVVKDRVGAPVGASGGYSTTYAQSSNIPLLASVYDEFEFFDAPTNTFLLCPTQKYVPTLLNGWTTSGAPDGSPAIIYDRKGLFLQGEVTGTASTGVVIFTLPAAQRPLSFSTTRSYCFLTTTSDEGGGVTVQLRYLYATGDFRLENSPASKANIVLDGLFIPAQI